MLTYGTIQWPRKLRAIMPVLAPMKSTLMITHVWRFYREQSSHKGVATVHLIIFVGGWFDDFMCHTRTGLCIQNIKHVANRVDKANFARSLNYPHTKTFSKAKAIL